MTTTTAPTKRPRKPRGEYAKTAEKREAILDAALEVFAESGYRAGSLREVAVRVGMSEAGLLHHFRSKSTLLEAVLERRDDRSQTLMPVESDDGVAVVRGLVDLARYNASVPGVVELYCTLSAEATSPDHPAHAYFLRRYAYTRGVLERSFRQLATEGRLRGGMNPRRAAIMVIAMMDGLQVQWLLDREVLDMADELKSLLSRVVDIDWDAPTPDA
jgi:AcrR family transcriptional regulator